MLFLFSNNDLLVKNPLTLNRSLKPLLRVQRRVPLRSTTTMSSPAYGPVKRKADNLPPSTPADAKKSKTDASITSFFGAPRSASASSKPAATISSLSSRSPATPKFDKGQWVAKLSPEQRTLLKLEIDTLEESWLAHLRDEILTPGFLELKRFLKAEMGSGKRLFPPMEEVYSWWVICH